MSFNKCICIKQCIFFRIDETALFYDDGKFEYEVGKEYEYVKETDGWGTYYRVIYSDTKDICFWESEMNAEGFRLTIPDKVFNQFFKIGDVV